MNIQAAVNWPLRKRLGSLILGQSLAGGVRDRYCTSSSFMPLHARRWGISYFAIAREQARGEFLLKQGDVPASRR
jgi:hypothetical protein